MIQNDRRDGRRDLLHPRIQLTPGFQQDGRVKGPDCFTGFRLFHSGCKQMLVSDRLEPFRIAGRNHQADGGGHERADLMCGDTGRPRRGARMTTGMD